MLQDRLVDATNRLDVGNVESVRQFRRLIRQTLGVFLRFTQRYWFHDVSDHTQAKELFRMISGHLGTARLYTEVRTAIEDMNQATTLSKVSRIPPHKVKDQTSTSSS